jgi:hypothetical protein
MAANGAAGLPAQALERMEQRQRLLDTAAALHARMIEVRVAGRLPG